ncbi:MAG TPA: hypothetical protein VJT73_00505 [Polyangiaceae bacterium]|nr:hypothetical protein [Polyangiaceae bacterium]
MDRGEAGERGRSDTSRVDAPVAASSSSSSASEGLEGHRDCSYLLDLGSAPADRGQVSVECIALLVAVAGQKQPRSADAARWLGTHCEHILSFMETDCAGGRRASCEEELAQITVAGPSCDAARQRGTDLVKKAHETDARLANGLCEADRIIELRRALCEKQNRGTRCRDLKWQTKEHSSPEPPGSAPNLLGDRPPEPSCVVAPRAACPSTRATDRESVALAQSFQKALAGIDDARRYGAVCHAWQNAVIYCERPMSHPGCVLDAGATK